MKDDAGVPDVAAIAALIGDRARATILLGLMDGRALTATELARAAAVTKQTASSHLAKLVAGRLVSVESVGRHRYFRLSGHDIGVVIEDLMVLARRAGVTQVRTGPAEPALRKARVCYDHLAGELGVRLFDRLLARDFVRVHRGRVTLTALGEEFLEGQGIAVGELQEVRRPMCRACLDWSARRPHLAGALGAALLSHFIDRGWARRQKASRVVFFSAIGERAFYRIWLAE